MISSMLGPDGFVLAITSELSRLRALRLVGELGVRMSEISILLRSLFSHDLETGSSTKLVSSIPAAGSLDRGTQLGVGSDCSRA